MRGSMVTALTKLAALMMNKIDEAGRVPEQAS